MTARELQDKLRALVSQAIADKVGINHVQWALQNETRHVDILVDEYNQAFWALVEAQGKG